MTCESCGCGCGEIMPARLVMDHVTYKTRECWLRGEGKFDCQDCGDVCDVDAHCPESTPGSHSRPLHTIPCSCGATPEAHRAPSRTIPNQTRWIVECADCGAKASATDLAVAIERYRVDRDVLGDTGACARVGGAA